MLRCPSCSFQNSTSTSFCGKCRLYLRPIGDYKLLRAIGKGGFASVYEAAHQKTGKMAAIKILHREFLGQTEIEHRFLREAKVLLELNSPQVVKLYDFGFCEDKELGIYLIMEWCKGQTLSDAISHRPARRFAPSEAFALFSQLLSGLQHIHQKRVVHRDLKPSNLMLVEDKGETHLKILDFGLAWVNEDTLTKTGTVIGSLRYMAPEQIRGEKDKYGPTTDIYSAALILAWMLTGKHVFSGSTVEMLAMQHTLERPPSLQELCPDIRWPTALEHALSRALQKEPSQRFHSAQEFLQALETPSISQITGSHFSPMSVSPYEETMTMGHAHNKTFHRKRWIWLLPLFLLILTGLFIYMIAIAPQFLKNPRGQEWLASESLDPSVDGGSWGSSQTPETSLSSLPPDHQTTEPHPPVVPTWIQTILSRWQQSWLQLKQKPLPPQSVQGYRRWYHDDFFDKIDKLSLSDYLQHKLKLAQQSSWFTVTIEDVKLIQQTSQDFTVQFHQILTYSTIKADGGPEADISGSVYRKASVIQLYWRKMGTVWKIWQANGYEIKEP